MAHMINIPDKLQQLVDNTKCQYVKLGDSGLKVSKPIFGAMGLGDKRWVWPWVVEGEEALEVLGAAWERGINTWDTANIFSNGESERLIAQAIKKYNIPRHKLVIMTKVFTTVGEVPENVMAHAAAMRKTKEYCNQSGLSRQAIFNAVNASLERLQTDYIDVLQLHRADSNVSPEETMTALNDLVRSGKVRYLGACSMWVYEFMQYQYAAERLGLTKIICMQGFYNLLYREEEREMNKYCKKTGVGLIPWSPLCRGHLARRLEDSKQGKTVRSKDEIVMGTRYGSGTGEPDESIIKRVEEVADKRGWQMSDVALAWLDKRVTSPVVGFTSVEQIDNALEYLGKELTAEEERYLEELYQAKFVQGHA